MAVKIEVGKKYELNNGDVREFVRVHGDDHTAVDKYGFGPFFIESIGLYHQDGRFADADADHEYSVKLEVLTVQVGKYYRTRDGRKVGPMVQWTIDANHPFEVTNEDGTELGLSLWSESGRSDGCSDHDLIAEWTETGTGTLAELDVKPGDVVEWFNTSVVNPMEVISASIITSGAFEGQVEAVLSGYGSGIFSVEQFRIISRASDTTKTWGEMTNAEKGELLLAECEGKVIEVYAPGMGVWHRKRNTGFIGRDAYRIKQEPVRETESLYVFYNSGFGVEGTSGTDWPATHRITFTTTDGKPDLDSIKMEDV